MRELLITAEGVAFEDDEKLVRGLDYYTRTTFEFVHDGLGSQSAVGGGGRYDGLSEMIGGPALPSVGWALGVDRTVLALEAEGVTLELPSTTSVFAVPLGEEARRVLFAKVTELRRAGIAADFSFGGKGLKGAMKNANRSRRPLHPGRRRARPRGGRGPAEGHGVRRADAGPAGRDRGRGPRAPGLTAEGGCAGGRGGAEHEAPAEAGGPRGSRPPGYPRHPLTPAALGLKQPQAHRPRHRRRAVVDPQLAEDPHHMGLHRRLRDEQPPPDLRVGAPLRHQPQHRHLPLGEPRPLRPGPELVEEAPRDRGRQHGLAPRRGPHGPGQFTPRQVLEQVAESPLIRADAFFSRPTSAITSSGSRGRA